MPHRICSGPSHDKPTSIPVTDEYWIIHKRTGQVYSWCRQCRAYSRVKNYTGNHGWIPLTDRVVGIFAEIENRVGRVEAARRIKITRENYTKIIVGKRTRVRKQTAANAILVLRELRKDGVVRHKKSIKHGAALRGRKERKVRRVHEQNGSIFPELEAAEREKEALRKQAERRGISLEDWMKQKEEEGRCI